MGIAASGLLAACVEPKDTEWVLDLYIPEGFNQYRLMLWGTIAQLSFERAEARLLQESDSPDPIRRMASLYFAIGLKQDTTTHHFISRFTADSDLTIAREARLWLYRHSGSI